MSLRNSGIVDRKWLALVLSVIVMAGLWLTPQAQEPRRNPEAQKLNNPEPKNTESIEAGKRLYQRYCASCHGPNGKGDGGLALSGGEPSDLTDDSWDYGSTDGEIFVVIRDGVSADMLAYKERLNQKQIWQVVNYIRSIGPKQSK
ncbi:MAG TPA: c-type cytochrome [Blastocatellia bacterium]|nr:c-type cytochrome [Blastocatellia bacterium]